MDRSSEFEPLVSFLARVPAFRTVRGTGHFDDGNWWIKFVFAIEHPLVWHAVQEFSCVLNYLSTTERLPTIFKPVSPAPYLNGGPARFLSWTIESTSPTFTPLQAAEWLESRLPRPVDDLSQWDLEDEEDEDAEENEDDA